MIFFILCIHFISGLLRGKLQKMLSDHSLEARASARDIVSSVIDMKLLPSKASLEQYLPAADIEKALRERSRDLKRDAVAASTFSSPTSSSKSALVYTGEDKDNDNDNETEKSSIASPHRVEKSSKNNSAKAAPTSSATPSRSSSNRISRSHRTDVGLTVDSENFGANMESETASELGSSSSIGVRRSSSTIDRSIAGTGNNAGSTYESIAHASPAAPSSTKGRLRGVAVGGNEGGSSNGSSKGNSIKLKASIAVAKISIEDVPELQNLSDTLTTLSTSKDWQERRDLLSSLTDVIIEQESVLSASGKMESCIDRILERLDDGNTKVMLRTNYASIAHMTMHVCLSLFYNSEILNSIVCSHFDN